ncbi:hypothetical protein DIPPA_14946 [Diplonema papillatum]|nr:hypothetical protein DIPPA_14946 [Diplonema papillatum]
MSSVRSASKPVRYSEGQPARYSKTPISRGEPVPVRSSPQSYGSGSGSYEPTVRSLTVADGAAIHLPEGTIKRVVRAVYKVEGHDVQKDVTDRIAPLVTHQGALQLQVNSEFMGIHRPDPYAGESKSLMLTYVPILGSSKTVVGSGEQEQQTLRVPEHGRITLPPGSIVRLQSAEYRVENAGDRGLQKDVLPVIEKHVRNGGLDLLVNNATMGVLTDPSPESEKVLVVRYTPRVEPEAVLLELRQDEWFELPEGSIARLLEADWRLPFHEKDGHGWAVDVYDKVVDMIYRGGIKGRRVSSAELGIDYDPFDQHAKVLRILYKPTRLRIVTDQQAFRNSVDRYNDTLAFIECMTGCEPYRCSMKRSDPRSKLLHSIQSLVYEVQSQGGWGEDKMMRAQKLLGEVGNETERTMAQKLIYMARTNYIASAADMLRRMGYEKHIAEAGMQSQAQARGGETIPVCEPDMHPSIAYHVGKPMGKQRYPTGNVEFVRVPESGRLTLPKGTIIELLSAEYRVEERERSTRGVQKDVFDAINSLIVQGGLDITIDNRTLKVVRDPYPGRPKVLVMSYVPRADLGIIEVKVPEGSMFQLPETSVDSIISAEYRLPYDDTAGHGWAVDVMPVVAAQVKNGGLKAFLVSRETLKVPYDPFPGRPKMLKLQYVPSRSYATTHWGGVGRKTTWASRQISSDAGCKVPYDPREDVYYRKNPEHPPSVVVSQGTDSYHVSLLESVLSLLKDVEMYGVADDRRLREVEDLLRTVKADRQNRMHTAAGHIIGVDPDNSRFWSSPLAILTRMGFGDNESRQALRATSNSLTGAVQLLVGGPSRPYPNYANPC